MSEDTSKKGLSTAVGYGVAGGALGAGAGLASAANRFRILTSHRDKVLDKSKERASQAFQAKAKRSLILKRVYENKHLFSKNQLRDEHGKAALYARAFLSKSQQAKALKTSANKFSNKINEMAPKLFGRRAGIGAGIGAGVGISAAAISNLRNKGTTNER